MSGFAPGEWDEIYDPKDQYAQCEIRKGDLFQIAWIPKKFAVVGRVLRIKYPHGWQDGWLVAIAYLRTIKTRAQLPSVKGFDYA